MFLGDISLVTIIFQSIFLGFPDEIIEMIFDKLDFIDLCNVRGVNKRFYRIEGKVKKPLLKRKNLMISVGSTSSYICLKFSFREKTVYRRFSLLLLGCMERRFHSIKLFF